MGDIVVENEQVKEGLNDIKMRVDNRISIISIAILNIEEVISIWFRIVLEVVKVEIIVQHVANLNQKVCIINIERKQKMDS